MDPTVHHVITASLRRKKRNKIGLLTVVLTILADGESDQVTRGSREIYLDVEALGFLQEKYKKCREENEERERDVYVNGVKMFLLLS